jgi:predicted dehydrogenase
MTRIRWGMAGGGEGAFIGAAHRMAARLDDRYILLAGCLSSTPDKARRSGLAIGLEEARAYPDVETMARAEAARPDGIEAVTIVTPNVSHAPIARLFLEHGIHVICDKPLATSLADAAALQKLAAQKGLLLGVTYNYTGYPLIRHARTLVAEGRIGEPRIIKGEFALGWLSTPVEREGSKQAEWRTDPARAGPSFVIADLGTHAVHLASFVAGTNPVQVSCDSAAVVAGRMLEDDAAIRLRFANGARGDIWASMVAAGEQIGLRLRIYGTEGMLGWDQSRPDEMTLRRLNGSWEVLTRGAVPSPAARAATRMAAGLPEGYIEAFANLYKDYAERILATKEGRAPDPLSLLAPDAADGVMADAFVEACLNSAGSEGAWREVPFSARGGKQSG